MFIELTRRHHTGLKYPYMEVRRRDERLVYITVGKEVEERNPKSVLAVDLGIRWIATTVSSNNPKPRF